jgi:xylulokinase
VVTASLGTSGTVYAYSAEPVVDPVGEVAAFCDSTDQWLPLICTMNVTVATEQVRGLFDWDIAQLNHAIADTPAGAGGVIFLPYLSGERTPNLPRGSGVFHGLNALNMTPNAMARAVMEGATLGLAYGLNRLRSLKIKPTEIRLTGGGSKSQVWRQICADVFGVHVVCLATAEGAALGAALHSAWVDGLANNTRSSLTDLIQQAVKLNESSLTQPEPRSSELYQGIYSRFEGLTKSLTAAGFL